MPRQKMSKRSTNTSSKRSANGKRSASAKRGATASRKRTAAKSTPMKAGEFVRDEMQAARSRVGKTARKAKRAIALGLDRARKAGVKIPRGGKSASRGASSRAHAH